MLAGSLAAILDAALDSQGDIDHLEVCRLDDVLRRQRLRDVPVWPTEKLC